MPILSELKNLRMQLGSSERSSNPTAASFYRIAPCVRTSSDHGQIVILDTKGGHIYLCDGIRADFWRGLASGESRDAIIAAAGRHCGMAHAEVRKAFETFHREVIERNLIVPCHPA